MGWATFLLLPANVVVALFEPATAAGMVPISWLALWNWRRMLKRDAGDLQPTTNAPEG
jgi:hypothetical protein